MLGDQIERALATIGITSERAESWIGVPCGCKERKEKINALEVWARRVLGGKVSQAADYLNRILNHGEPS